MLDKIKEIIKDIKNDIEWILNGCPKPQPIKVPSKDRENKHERTREQLRS